MLPWLSQTPSLALNSHIKFGDSNFTCSDQWSIIEFLSIECWIVSAIIFSSSFSTHHQLIIIEIFVFVTDTTGWRHRLRGKPFGRLYMMTKSHFTLDRRTELNTHWMHIGRVHTTGDANWMRIVSIHLGRWIVTELELIHGIEQKWCDTLGVRPLAPPCFSRMCYLAVEVLLYCCSYNF